MKYDNAEKNARNSIVRISCIGNFQLIHFFTSFSMKFNFFMLLDVRIYSIRNVSRTSIEWKETVSPCIEFRLSNFIIYWNQQKFVWLVNHGSHDPSEFHWFHQSLVPISNANYVLPYNDFIVCHIFPLQSYLKTTQFSILTQRLSRGLSTFSAPTNSSVAFIGMAVLYSKR